MGKGYLKESTDYLRNFITNHISEYDYVRRGIYDSGYGHFHRKDDLKQLMINIYFNLEERLIDPRIPHVFPSPSSLIGYLKNFKELLIDSEELFNEINQNEERLPEPARQVWEVKNEVLEAVEHVLSLDEVQEYLNTPNNRGNNVFEILEHISTKFKRFVSIIEDRHANRPTVTVDDEYDVQDILHSILSLYFEDIRKEEWTPSYAGGSSRIDFLLKRERVAVEIKMTNENLNTRKIGDQLIEDKERYRKSPEADSLFCFVYDPDMRIKNPSTIEDDLTESVNGFNVKVVVKPGI